MLVLTQRLGITMIGQHVAIPIRRAYIQLLSNIDIISMADVVHVDQLLNMHSILVCNAVQRVPIGNRIVVVCAWVIVWMLVVIVTVIIVTIRMIHGSGMFTTVIHFLIAIVIGIIADVNTILCTMCMVRFMMVVGMGMVAMCMRTMVCMIGMTMWIRFVTVDNIIVTVFVIIVVVMIVVMAVMKVLRRLTHRKNDCFSQIYTCMVYYQHEY